MARTAVDDRGEGVLEDVALALPAHHRRLVASAGAPPDGDQPVGLERLGLALRRDRLDRLGLDRVAHEPVGLLAEQHLARRRGLLEARGHVDRVPGREALLGAGDDLAGVDAHAELEARPVAQLELVVQLAEGAAQLVGGAHGPERVVLVHGRHAEDGHDRVADELLHGPAVALDDRLRRLEVARHHPAQALGVDPLAERGRAGHIAEEDGDDLARLPRGFGLGERRAAGVAEPRALAGSRPRSSGRRACASLGSRVTSSLWPSPTSSCTSRRSGKERVHPYTSEEPLAPGDVVRYEGRDWLVERLDGTRVAAEAGALPAAATAPRRARGARRVPALPARRSPGRAHLQHARGRAAGELAGRRRAARRRDEHGEPVPRPDRRARLQRARGRAAACPSTSSSTRSRARTTPRGGGRGAGARRGGGPVRRARRARAGRGARLGRGRGVHRRARARGDRGRPARALRRRTPTAIRARRGSTPSRSGCAPISSGSGHDVEGDHDEIEEWEFRDGRIFAAVGSFEERGGPGQRTRLDDPARRRGRARPRPASPGSARPSSRSRSIRARC